MYDPSRIPPTEIVRADTCTGSNSMFVKVWKPLPECEKEEGLELCKTYLVRRKLKETWVAAYGAGHWGRTVRYSFTNRVDHFTMSGLYVCAWIDVTSIHLDVPLCPPADCSHPLPRLVR